MVDSFSGKKKKVSKKKVFKKFLKFRRNNTTKYSFAFMVYTNNEYLHRKSCHGAPGDVCL